MNRQTIEPKMIPCLSGFPDGERQLTRGCKCNWCAPTLSKFPLRELTLDNVLDITRRHDKCSGNILGALAAYQGQRAETITHFLHESGFTEDEIKVGIDAFDKAVRFLEQLKMLGYKYDPLSHKPFKEN